MKIFILLLALGLCLADAVPGGYQQIDAAEAQADPTIQSYIQAGLNAVVQNANNKGFFSNSDFDLKQINSVYEQVVNGMNYKFDCNFTDSNGVILRANFVVSHSASTNVTTVPSFSYKVYYPPTTNTTTTTTATPSNTTVEAAGETVTDGETTAITPAEEETEGFIMPVDEAIVTDNSEAVEEEEEVVAETSEEASVESPEEAVVVPEEENVTVVPEEENTEETTTTPPVVVVSADGFTSISADEYAQSEDLQKYFAFGFQTVVQNGINANKIPNTTFASAQVLSASQKALKNGERYKFIAQASNGDNVDLNLTFEVAYQVPSYSYSVKVTTTTPSNDTGSGSGSGSNNTNTTVPVVPVIPVIPDTGSQNNTDNTGSNNNTSTNTTVPVIPDSGSQNTTNSTGSNNNTSTNTTSDGWVNIDVAQVQSNAEIQSNLVNGFNQVIDTAVLKKGLKADNYTITQVVSAGRKNLTNGVNYKFTVKGQNAAGNTLLDMNFTTYYRYSNKSVKTVAYNYKYSIKNIPVPAQNNTNQPNTTTGNTNSTDNTNTTTPVDNTNSTVPTNNTTPVNNTTNSTNTPTPSTNTTSNNTNGYVALSADQIQGQDVQSALNYGSAQVVQLGQQKNKIPTDTYNITQVASVLKKIQPAGANYNCTVTLKSAANVTVTTNFNVFSNSTSNAMILKAYSYQVSGIKKN